VNEVSNGRNGNDSHTHTLTYTVTVTAELMSNDTKFARVGDSKRKKRKGNRFIHLIEFCVPQKK
jgi:hypothetical protein